jgi:hypothetical protein
MRLEIDFEARLRDGRMVYVCGHADVVTGCDCEESYARNLHWHIEDLDVHCSEAPNSPEIERLAERHVGEILKGEAA